jgi:sortase A
MRRGRLILTAVCVFVLLAIAATAVTRSPAKLAATSAGALTAASVKPSLLPSASPTPTATATAQPTEAPQPNAAAVAPAAAPAANVAARISIPRIGIKNAPIYDRGTDAKGVMLIAPGYSVTHYAFSAPFGTGNTVLYGHDDIQGSIFGHLYDLGPGDLINVTVAGQTQTYRVSSHEIVAPTSVGVLAPTGDVRLTLITCWPYNVDTKRWIVTAFKN